MVVFTGSEGSLVEWVLTAEHSLDLLLVEFAHPVADHHGGHRVAGEVGQGTRLTCPSCWPGCARSFGAPVLATSPERVFTREQLLASALTVAAVLRRPSGGRRTSS